jgi:hypothetical protein
VYLARAFILVWPRLSKKTFSPGWLKGGIIAAFLPEVILVLMTFNLLFEDGSSCSTGGPYSSCGWGELLYAVIGLSCIVQAIGMIIGGLAGRGKSK